MKVELSIWATKLKNVAGAFKGTSDPFAVVTNVATTSNDKPEVLGKTEVVKNSLSPHWVKVFVLDYEMGTPKKVVVSLFDEVRKGENISMGSAVFDIGELLGARGNTKAKKIKKGGTIFAHVRKSTGSGILRMKMKGTSLKNTEGLFSKSDPFFELSRRVDSAGGLTWDNVYRSKWLKNNLNPVWEDAIIELSLLCGGDQDKPIQVTVYDHESSGKHVLMGSFESTVNGFKQAAANNTPIDLKKRGKKTGTMNILKAEVAGVEGVTTKMAATSVSPPTTTTTAAPYVGATAAAAAPAYVPAPAAPKAAAAVGGPTFVDYVSGGCQLQVCVAIDFTGSNGDPRKPGTLHYLHRDGTKNDYEKAISAIVGILEKYDTDKQFPVWGFGAKYGGVIRHCFQCGPTAEVNGVQGVLNAYHQVFRSGLVMSGPTVFTEVMQTAADHATKAQNEAQRRGEQVYTILLILTDGAVSDVNATAAALDRASDAPLSVVIVGVGRADFRAMQFLDDSNQPGKRDIAQFVEFNRHSANSVALTSETLHEIPDQVVGFFTSKGIAPRPPIQRGDSEIVVESEEEEIDLSLDFGGEDEEIVVAAGGNDFRDGF